MVGVICRSGFGQQSGVFELVLFRIDVVVSDGSKFGADIGLILVGIWVD